MMKNLSTRRNVLRIASGMAVAEMVPSHAANHRPVDVRLGWIPLGGASCAITMVMIRDKLFEKQAEKLGYKVNAEWKSFTAGPPMNEAMTAGLLDLDMHVTGLPTASRIAAGVPAIPIATIGSNIANAVMVPPNSPIRDISDLSGKTIALPFGTSTHYFLANLIYAHFGKSIQDSGIRLINMPVVDAVKIPNGVDAAVAWVPQRYSAVEMGLSQLLVDASGLTGPAYKQPGTRVPEVKKAWAYPEGYITDRLYAFASESFMAKNPEVVLAFLLAHDQAQGIVVADLAGAVALAQATWKWSDAVTKLALQTYAETSGIRQCSTILEADVMTVLKASEFQAFQKVIDRPLTWDAVKPLFMKSAAMQRRAWEARGGKPTLVEMVKGFSGTSPGYGPIQVNGGAPVWEWAGIADWGKRIDVPGPFARR